MSIHTPVAQDELQWSQRNLQDELEVCCQRTLADTLIRYLPKDGTVVEAGAGLGGWVRWLKDRGYSSIGIDCFQDVIDASREADASLDMRLGRVEALPFDDNSISAYISLGVIEHFENGPQNVLKEAYRVLQHGGIAVISTPALNHFRKLFTHPIRSAAIHALRIVNRPIYFWEYRFTKEELITFIEEAGFTIIGVEVDEIKPSRDRHIGLSADFFIFRDSSGAWKLNAIGRAVRFIARVLPDHYYACGNVVIAQKT
jgi:ubiquinone/menaquinone biosynthesis C-methylase UbiE